MGHQVQFIFGFLDRGCGEAASLYHAGSFGVRIIFCAPRQRGKRLAAWERKTLKHTRNFKRDLYFSPNFCIIRITNTYNLAFRMPKKKNNSRRLTQKDIAQAAGVSQATVSQVLNHAMHDSIPAETRQRILDAIDKLGYVPDRTARSLRTNKTYTLAAIIPDITNPYYPTFIRGIQDVAEDKGYDLVIYNTDGEKQKEEKYLRAVRQNNVDGLIAVLFHRTSDDLAELDIPVVHLQPKPETPQPVDVIYIDNAGASCEIVNYLIQRGYDCIGMIAGEEDTPPRRDRFFGYRQALTEHQIPLDEILIRGGYLQSGRWLPGHARVIVSVKAALRGIRRE